MSVKTRNFRTQDLAVRHIGPTAQGFSAAFGAGADSQQISVVDAQAVAVVGSPESIRDDAGKGAEVAELPVRVDALEHQGEGAAMNYKWPPEWSYLLGIFLGAMLDDFTPLFAGQLYIVIGKWLIVGGTYYLCRHLANWLWTSVATGKTVPAMPGEGLIRRS